MASRFLHDPKYALAYGLLALLLLLAGGLLFREAGHLRERAEGTAAENQLLRVRISSLRSFKRRRLRPMRSCWRRQASP